MAEPLHDTCIDVTAPQFGEAPGSSWVCGPECPRPAGPDPERDKRIDVYRDRERRRAARALDRYIEAMFLSPTDVPQRLGMGESRVAADRFVEAVGDYVLARLGEIEGRGPVLVLAPQPMTPSEVEGIKESWAQHNSHYGVPLAECPKDGFTCPDHPGVTHHNAAYGATECEGCGGQLTAHGFHQNGQTRCPDDPIYGDARPGGHDI